MIRLAIFLIPVSMFAQLGASPGSLYSASGRLADTARDVRASEVNDIVTIVVNEAASAVVTGTSNSSRKSSVNASITGAYGITSPEADQPARRDQRYRACRIRHHLPQLVPVHHDFRARRRSPVQRKPGHRRHQGHRRQLRQAIHHRARRGPPRRPQLRQHGELESQVAGSDDQGHTARASWAMRSAARTSSIASCSACFPLGRHEKTPHLRL